MDEELSERFSMVVVTTALGIEELLVSLLFGRDLVHVITARINKLVLITLSVVLLGFVLGVLLRLGATSAAGTALNDGFAQEHKGHADDDPYKKDVAYDLLALTFRAALH